MKPNPAERENLRKRVLRLRAAGLDDEHVAERLKIQIGQVKEFVAISALRVQEMQDITSAIDATRLDAMTTGLWSKATSGDKAAVDTVLRLMDRRSKTLTTAEDLAGHRAALREAIKAAEKDRFDRAVKNCKLSKLVTHPEIADKFYDGLAAGNFRCVSAEMSGISQEAISDWMKRGLQDNEEPFATFALSVLKIEAANEARHLEAISKSDDWHAHRWILERKYPTRWGERPKQVELSGPEGGPMMMVPCTPAHAAQVVRETFGAVTPDAESSPSPVHPGDTPA